LSRPSHLHMQLMEGPFKTLQGDWWFTAINDATGQVQGTRIELHICFEFKNALLNMMLGKAFEANCVSLVSAFTQRANQLYEPG